MSATEQTQFLMGELERGVCIEISTDILPQVSRAINAYFSGQFVIELDRKIAKIGPIRVRPTDAYKTT